MVSEINRFLKSLKTIKVVRLNKGGKIIGKICRYGNKIVYFSYRNNSHFYIKTQGYAIDNGILKKIIDEEVGLRKATFDPRFKLYIVIYYNGKRERKILVTDPLLFFIEGADIEYSKERGNDWESYGRQKVIPESKMVCLLREAK